MARRDRKSISNQLIVLLIFLVALLGYSPAARAPTPVSRHASTARSTAPPARLLKEHPRWRIAPPASAVRFSFAVLSDTHNHHRCQLGQGRWVSEAVKWLNARAPAFVVGDGDLVAGGGDCQLASWRQPDDLAAQLDELRRVLLVPLRAPFVPVSGNHDLADRRSRDPHYATRTWSRFWASQAAELVPGARRLAKHTSVRFEVQGVGIVILGYYGDETLHREEIAWASAHIRPGDLVFRHVNPFGVSCLEPGFCGIAVEHGGDLPPARLTDLLRWRGVAALFSGHTHAFYAGVCDGLPFVNTGSLGRRSMEYVRGWDDSPYAKRQAFVWVDVLRSGAIRTTFMVWDEARERFMRFDPVAFPPVVEVEKAERFKGVQEGVPAVCVSLR